MRYRTKPVIVEAFQFDGDFMNSKGEYYVPKWAVDALNRGIMYFEGPELYIKTLEGAHHASIGDYIIQGIQGELCPCKPDIFEQTYERTEEQ